MEFSSIKLTKIAGGDGQTSLKSAHVAGVDGIYQFITSIKLTKIAGGDGQTSSKSAHVAGEDGIYQYKTDKDYRRRWTYEFKISSCIRRRWNLPV